MSLVEYCLKHAAEKETLFKALIKHITIEQVFEQAHNKIE